MANYNGQMILGALKTIEEPATLKTIVDEVAKKCGKYAEEVYDTVKSTLAEGVRLGFVQKKNRRYLVTDAIDNTDENNEEENASAEQPEDATRRRRRRRSTPRRRRSVSRRRRSRRSRS